MWPRGDTTTTAPTNEISGSDAVPVHVAHGQPGTSFHSLRRTNFILSPGVDHLEREEGEGRKEEADKMEREEEGGRERQPPSRCWLRPPLAPPDRGPPPRQWSCHFPHSQTHWKIPPHIPPHHRWQQKGIPPAQMCSSSPPPQP